MIYISMGHGFHSTICSIRFISTFQANDPENKYLEHAMALLEPIKVRGPCHAHAMRGNAAESSIDECSYLAYKVVPHS